METLTTYSSIDKECRVFSADGKTGMPLDDKAIVRGYAITENF